VAVDGEKARRGSRLLLGAFAVLWAVGVAAGMKALYDHSGTAGEAAASPRRWPTAAGIALDTRRPTLVMLAHPRCPCTRASVAELSVLMTRAQGGLSAHVLFVEPSGTQAGFAHGSLWDAARAIRGVEVHSDPGGHVADRFGARTSGQVMLYGIDGRLLFAGGITSSRGHQGDNAGLDRVLSLVRGGKAERSESSVFGCGLFDKKKGKS
jgi:hypothetical protein